MYTGVAVYTTAAVRVYGNHARDDTTRLLCEAARRLSLPLSLSTHTAKFLERWDWPLSLSSYLSRGGGMCVSATAAGSCVLRGEDSCQSRAPPIDPPRTYTYIYIYKGKRMCGMYNTYAYVCEERDRERERVKDSR